MTDPHHALATLTPWREVRCRQQAGGCVAPGPGWKLSRIENFIAIAGFELRTVQAVS
jgi:hypothetical protein